MKSEIKLIFKQSIKICLQYLLYPTIYRSYGNKVNRNLIVFVDSNSNEIPYSMKLLHETLKKEEDLIIIDFFYDSNKMSKWKIFKKSLEFMKIYSKAGVIILCNYYLPVSSCKKWKDTIVIQLWHSGGLLKKFAYDAIDDINPLLAPQMFKNFDLITVSASACIPVLARATHLPQYRFLATGISRTDNYFSQKYLENCKEGFYKSYPEAKGKQIILWAPTFRGNANNPQVIGYDEINSLRYKLPKSYYLIIKVHPLIDKKEKISNCDIPTEQLLSVVDILITDYSSILFDYIIFEKPFVLFAPDLSEYILRRGLYIEYDKLPGKIVKNSSDLLSAIFNINEDYKKSAIQMCKEYHMENCDGEATQRIKKLILNRILVDIY